MKPIQIVLSGIVAGSRSKNPTNINGYEVSALVPAQEVVKLHGIFANLREGYCLDPTVTKRSPVAKDIRETLEKEPATFHEKNLGLTVIADSAELESRAGAPSQITVTYSDSTFLKEHEADPNNRQHIRGIANGGTTIGVIADAIAKGEYTDNSDTAYVRVNFRCGSFDREDVSEIVGPLNTNKQVTQFEHENFNGTFDYLKNVLESEVIEGQSFPKVSFFIGDPGSYSVEELVQLITLMSRLDESGDPIPEMSYSGVSSCLKYFMAKENKQRVQQFVKFAPQIVKLYEYIQHRAPDVYNSGDKKFFALEAFKNSQLPKGVESPFMHYALKVKERNSWTFPLLAAFIPLLTIGRDGVVSWKQSPEAVFDRVGLKLVQKLNESHKKFNSRQNAVGRDADTYSALQTIVLRATTR